MYPGHMTLKTRILHNNKTITLLLIESLTKTQVSLPFVLNLHRVFRDSRNFCTHRGINSNIKVFAVTRDLLVKHMIGEIILLAVDLQLLSIYSTT